jgi:hypothetical protein
MAGTFHDQVHPTEAQMFLSMAKEWLECPMPGPITPIQDRQTLTAVPNLEVVRPFLSTVWPWQELVMPLVVVMPQPPAVRM